MNILITGANGRMGKALLEAISLDVSVDLAAACVRPSSELIGHKVSLLNNDFADQHISCLAEIDPSQVDVVIDFTLPTAFADNLKWCVDKQIPMVIGTTGLDSEQEELIKQASSSIPIVYAANYSVGVNVLIHLCQQVAPLLENDADIEIIEGHHRFKQDAPSGTALALGKAICEVTQLEHDNDAIYGREGHTGERPSKQLGYATVRGGDIVGDHTVLFAALGERLELSHKASSRLTFAKGAVRAAKWLKNKPAAYYTMMNVLSLG